VFKKRLPRVERQEMPVLDADQSARLLYAVRHSHVYWPVLIALTTGARRARSWLSAGENVDLDRGVIRIVESLEQTKAGLRLKPPKPAAALAQ
jgi:integrase